MSLPLLPSFVDLSSDSLMPALVARRLDEMDREEFFRLKKIQSKKKRDNAAREKEDAAKRAADEEAKYGSGAGGGGGGGGSEEGAGDLLNERDEDGASLPRLPRRLTFWTTCARLFVGDAVLTLSLLARSHLLIPRPRRSHPSPAVLPLLPRPLALAAPVLSLASLSPFRSSSSLLRAARCNPLA